MQDATSPGVQATCLLPPAAHSKVAQALSDGPETLWQALRRCGVNARPAVMVVNGQRLSQLLGQQAAVVVLELTGRLCMQVARSSRLSVPGLSASQQLPCPHLLLHALFLSVCKFHLYTGTIVNM